MDAKADLSLRWVHSHFVGIVMSQLILELQWIVKFETESSRVLGNSEICVPLPGTPIFPDWYNFYYGALNFSKTGIWGSHFEMPSEMPGAGKHFQTNAIWPTSQENLSSLQTARSATEAS